MATIFGVWSDPVDVPSSLLIALIAILIVFATLIVIILTTTLIQKGTDAVIAKVAINPKKENAILAEDPDAVVAALVATIDFHKATGKNARILSITQIEE